VVVTGAAGPADAAVVRSAVLVPAPWMVVSGAAALELLSSELAVLVPAPGAVVTKAPAAAAAAPAASASAAADSL
jgi:hypothetical protein